MNGATDWIPCPDEVGKTVINPVKLFVVLTQADPHPKFPGWTSPRALLCKLSALPVLLSVETPLGCTVCRSYLQPFWSDGPRRHYSAWSCSSAPCLGVSKLGSQPGKTLGFRILIRQICTPLNFLVRVCPPTWFCRWVRLMFGLIIWVLKVWTLPAKTHTVIAANPFSILHHNWLLAHRFPCNSYGVRSELGLPQSDPDAGRHHLSPWVLFSHWRYQRLMADLSAWYSTGLGKGQHIHVTTSLTLLMQSSLVSAIQGGML